MRATGVVGISSNFSDSRGKLLSKGKGCDLYKLPGSKDKNLVIILSADYNGLMMVVRNQYF